MGHLLKPLFKYPGGKGAEFKYLKKLFPKFNRYVEPFVGGGAVFWGIDADNWVINDYSQELISIYEYTQLQDPIFLTYLYNIGAIWEQKNQYQEKILSCLRDKRKIEYDSLSRIARDLLITDKNLPHSYDFLTSCLQEALERRLKTLDKINKTQIIRNWEENSLGVIGAAIYTYIRNMYNHTSFGLEPQLKSVLYFFLREYAYSGMFRYNADGLFNVPFGGNSYAKKSFIDKFEKVRNFEVISKLQRTQILRGDFSDALNDQEDTFLFLDPPYDTEFSTYNLHVFDSQEQIRLRDCLLNMNQSKWLMVVKSTDFIENLYEQPGWYKSHFDKSYTVNFKNRNEKDVKHLVITNYRMEDV